eukprot:TRINITY_DN11538_c0_g1_i2.p2 TRINITY_DN11538_c0_g1~~TRINITY_DN11538_c0_g1_i2.p2  ORF type:complete len:165 (+),score=13.66 TRINITY_DN11538_c0_g1_i2:769-1263(+)
MTPIRLSDASVIFTIEAVKDETSSKVILYVAIVLFSIAGIAFAFGLVKLTRYMCLLKSRRCSAQELARRCEEILKEVPESSYNSSESKFSQNTCSICLTFFIEGCLVRTLVCSHVFHKPCIEQWVREKINQRPKCPICIAELARNAEVHEGSAVEIGAAASNQV